MSELISVVVPIYNSENHLSQCIESILTQSYKELEILLVDDGSTDNSNEICKKYELIDKRVKVITSNNRGVSSARNIGIEASSGKWIGFVDSDDYISENMYQLLYQAIEKTDSDIAICGRHTINISGQQKKLFSIHEEKQYSNITAIQKMFTLNGLDSSVCDKLFNRYLFTDNKFPENRKVNEELCVVLKCFGNSNRIVQIPESLYIYRLWDGSSTHSIFSMKFLDSIAAAKEAIDICNSHYPEALVQAYAFLVNSKLSIIRKILEDDGGQYSSIAKEFQQELRNDFINVIRNKHMRSSQKFKYIISICNLDIYKVFNKIVYLKK